MARKPGNTPGGQIYHILNRAARRIALFRHDEDYAAFEWVLTEAHACVPLRLLAWCFMKNHWHFVIWPRRRDGRCSKSRAWTGLRRRGLRR